MDEKVSLDLVGYVYEEQHSKENKGEKGPGCSVQGGRIVLKTINLFSLFPSEISSKKDRDQKQEEPHDTLKLNIP